MVPGAEYLCIGNKQVFKDFLSSWELTPGNNLGSEPFFKNTAGLALKTLWGSDIIYPNTNSLKNNNPIGPGLDGERGFMRKFSVATHYKSKRYKDDGGRN